MTSNGEARGAGAPACSAPVLYDIRKCPDDRNRHGGGVLLYIKDIFVFRELPVDHCNNFEILPIEIRFLNISCCVTVYHPPNSQSFIFDALCFFVCLTSYL